MVTVLVMLLLWAKNTSDLFIASDNHTFVDLYEEESEGL